ncbi:major latex protein 15-like [Papaver somniferum]|uniref:major latex protein 15-like n=1 Tax=Papaver somniferum TaxID=3469 RepID=UPI000E6FAFD7|nr:major latex protein 15-like [Papaver somniferum]
MASYDYGLSGLIGKFIIQLEINSDADNFYEIYKHCKDVPKAVPHLFTGVKVTKGDELVSGCIKEWNYVLEGKAMTAVEETTIDDATRTLTHHVIEGDVMKDYKKFDVIIEANPKPSGQGTIGGSIVTVSIVYDRMNAKSPAPFDYYKFYYQNIVDMDAHISTS